MVVGSQAAQRQSVLFVCRFNAVRSQMAEAMLRDRYGDRYDACSAGLYPAGLDPWAVEVMAESGIDMA
ncbi:MAG: arsenate reductase ArsC, partial [Methanomicrobiales archaeon]|nr:arsenate reductase ArsC [Methanomicrobiales archaeon]